MAEREPISMIQITDHDWLRQSFMISHGTQLDSAGAPLAEDVKVRARFFTTAQFKFADTRVGGNVVMNPAPQFTRYADPAVKGLFEESKGMGRYYSEAIDDNKRIITMAFGVPQFNSLTSFYKGFYDHNAATVARTGRAPGVFYKAGQVIGFVAGFLSPWLVLYSVGSAFLKLALNQPSSKYYFFKPTMATYWNAVTGIANDIAVKTQLITRVLPDVLGDVNKTAGDDRTTSLTPKDVNEINDHIKDMVDSYDEKTGQGDGINVYAVATKYQRIQRAAFKALEAHYHAQSIADGFETTVDEEGNAMLRVASVAINDHSIRRPKRSFTDYLKEWSEGTSPGAFSAPGGEDKASLTGSLDKSAQAGTTTGDPSSAGTAGSAPQGSSDLLTEKSITTLKPDGSPNDSSGVEGWRKFLTAELDDGAQYVSFRVENSGDASESFSNQVGESEISAKINGISGSKRSTRFSFADGNVGDGVIAGAIQGTIGAVKDVAMGAANSLGLDGIAALGGNAFADIPKHWMQSTTNMPSMSYRIKLTSPYGNRYSRFVNIWLPLSMLLAGALPLSTGPHSYTSPFLCQLFDRGRAQTRLGMIDNLSITRGGTNLAFNKIGEPMSIEVSFSVVELSNILHMPISQAFNPVSPKNIFGIFDNESLYHDYMAVLTSLSLTEQIYVGERMKIGLTRYMKNLDSWFSVPHAMNALGDFAPVKIFNVFFEGVANR